MSYVVGCCNIVAGLSMADMVRLDCMQKLSSAWAMLVVCWSLSYAVKFYYCWTWSPFMCIRLEWAKLSAWFIQCVWNRLSACTEFCDVRSWQNGTRCRDSVKVLWYHSHLVWLIFEASIPTCTCFLQKTFCDLFPLLFFLLFLYCRLGMVREKKGGRGRHMVNFFVHIKLRIIINSNASKWNCKFIHHTSLSMGV